jgi:methionine-rich copper-binding protein CopC
MRDDPSRIRHFFEEHDVKSRLAIAALLFLLCGLSVPTFAATPPAKMLVASAPARDSESKAAVDRVSLSFAEQVELLSVTILLPDESEREVFQASYEPGAAKKKGKAFDFPLAEPLTVPGRYKISYLLTSKSVKSLNGFIDFEIAGNKILYSPTDETVTTADPQTSPEAS